MGTLNGLPEGDGSSLRSDRANGIMAQQRLRLFSLYQGTAQPSWCHTQGLHPNSSPSHKGHRETSMGSPSTYSTACLGWSDTWDRGLAVKMRALLQAASSLCTCSV